MMKGMERTTKEGRKMENGATKESALRYIEELQAVCKSNPPTSLEWLKASKELNAMFKMMARYENGVAKCDGRAAR
jgi:hypothetical protein